MKKPRLSALPRMDIIVALYIFFTIVAEVMGAKTFPLLTIGTFTLSASVAIFVLPFLYSMTDIVLEVYGPARARSLVYLGIGTVVLLMLYTLLATALPPTTRFAPHEAAYDEIFNFSLRLSLASIAAFAVAQLLDVAIFARLRARMHKRALWLRNNLSNFIGFFVDSAVFLTLAFYMPDKSLAANALFITGLLLPHWGLKCALSVLETPLVYAGVRWLQKGSRQTKSS